MGTSRRTKFEPLPLLQFRCSMPLQNAAVARIWCASCAQTRTKHEPQQHFEVQSGCGCSLVVSIFKMWLWYVFWACQNRRKRSGITPVQRNRFPKVCRISPTIGPVTPERVGRGTVYQFSVYSIQYTVSSWQLTGGDSGQVLLR